MRVDEQLVKEALAESLEKAKLLVMEGRVYLGEEKVSKPSDPVKPGRGLSVRELRPYVSRGAVKLLKAFDVFQLSVDSKVCIDIGASTGGFTDVLIKRGASRVYAVDVGYGLLDSKIRNHEKVVVMERTNARFLKREQFSPLPSFGAADASFISLKAILPPAFSLMEDADAQFVALIKPQFEAKKQMVKGGVVRDAAVHEQVIKDAAGFVAENGWTPAGLTFSPIRGTKGNVEFLLLATRMNAMGVTNEEIQRVVQACQDFFVKSPKKLV